MWMFADLNFLAELVFVFMSIDWFLNYKVKIFDNKNLILVIYGTVK